MQPYIPHELPLATLDYARLIGKIGPANAALARYDGLLQSVINPGVMLSPLTNREAVLSSKIEGTQATVVEVREYEAGRSLEQARQTALPFLRTLREAGVLHTLREASGRRSAILAFRQLLTCAEGRQVI